MGRKWKWPTKRLRVKVSKKNVIFPKKQFNGTNSDVPMWKGGKCIKYGNFGHRAQFRGQIHHRSL